MALKYINKDQTLFLLTFYSMLFKKDVPILLELFSKKVVPIGYQVVLNPFINESFSIDKYFENECRNVKTINGVYFKAKKESSETNQDNFKLSFDFIKRIEKLCIQPIRYDKYWLENSEDYLKFIEYASSKTKESNYSVNYVELLWTLTSSSYTDFINSIPGLEKKINKIFQNYNLLDNPFYGNYKNLNIINQNYIKINFDVLITNNLERFFKLDETNVAIFKDENWKKYYLGNICEVLLDNNNNVLKQYINNSSFKSALDFLAQEYKEELPEKLKKFFIDNKIGLSCNINDSIFLKNEFNTSYLIKINNQNFKKNVPAVIANTSNFEIMFSNIIAGVIENITNDTVAEVLTSQYSTAINIQTNSKHNESYFKNIIKKCLSEVSILSVENNTNTIINRISILVNEMIMQNDAPQNLKVHKKSFKL